jgi:hypothetical protein
MKSDERKAYIEAVQCMLSSPSKSDPIAVPGARVRQASVVNRIQCNHALTRSRTATTISSPCT